MSKADMVRGTFKGRKLTVRDIAAELGWKTDVVHGVITSLIKANQVLIVGKKKVCGDKSMHVMELAYSVTRIVNQPKVDPMPLWDALGLPRVKTINLKDARQFEVDDFPHWDERLKPLKCYIGTSHRMIEGAL